MKYAALILFLVPTLAFSYSGGPPNGYTGAPGEGNCTQCHSSNALNSGNGSFSIDGPAEYVPGQTYTLTLTLQDPGQGSLGLRDQPGRSWPGDHHRRGQHAAER